MDCPSVRRLGHFHRTDYTSKQEIELVALNASTVIGTTYLAELHFKAAWGEILTAGGNFCWKQNIIL